MALPSSRGLFPENNRDVDQCREYDRKVMFICSFNFHGPLFTCPVRRLVFSCEAEWTNTWWAVHEIDRTRRDAMEV